MLTLLYDHTYEGLLSCVFEVYRLKMGEVRIVPEDEYQEQLFNEPIRIDTVQEHAARVAAGLRKLDKACEKMAYRCFLSEHPRREEIILHYIRRALAEGPAIVGDLLDDRMILLKKLDQQLSREVHRMHAFVRFQQTPDDLYVALVNPDFNVLPLLGKHFIARYPAQDWLIYDTIRHFGLLWDQQKADFITFTEGNHQRLRQLSDEMLAGRETDYQQLWKSYFHAVDIPERRNIKLHLQHVPRRYHKYLVEKWGD